MFLSFRLGAIVISNIPKTVTDIFTPEEVPATVDLCDLDKRLELLVPGIDGQQATLLFRRGVDFSDILELDMAMLQTRKGSIRFRKEGSDVTESCVSHLLSKSIHEELYQFVRKTCVDKFGEEVAAEEFSLVVLDPETPIPPGITDSDDLGKYLLTNEKLESRLLKSKEIALKQKALKEEQKNEEKDPSILFVDLT